MRRKSYLIVVALIVAVVPFVIAACGSSSSDSSSASPMSSASPTAAMKDIVDTAVAAGDFNTLAQALTAAGLVDTLKGEGPYTVFAPTDAAFADVPKATLDSLLADPKGALTDVLTYHVVPGTIMAADITDGQTVETVNGAKLTFKVAADGSVMVNDANVTTADIQTSNGVIHVIDAVLIPPSK
jgi:transforming growth factor-beta-induced protein